MRLKNKILKGFTLIELVVVLAVFGLIIAAALAVLNPVSNVYKNTYQYTDSQTMVDNLRRTMEDNMRFANRVRIFTNVGINAGYTEEQFVEDEVNNIRTLFHLNDSSRRQYSLDEVFCIKIDNPETLFGASEPGGKITLWEYDNGSLSSSSREWLVNEAYYMDYSFVMTFENAFTTEAVSGADPIVYLNKSYTPVQGVYDGSATFASDAFSFEVNVFQNFYRDRRNKDSSAIDMIPTNVQSNVSLALTNITSGGTSMLTEHIDFADGPDPDTDDDFVDVARYRHINVPGDITDTEIHDSTGTYTNLGISTSTTSGDIYIFYTKPHFD